MEKRFGLMAAVVLVGVLITGCLGGGSQPPLNYTLSGSVVEADTRNPISGAVVSLDSKQVVTDPEGNFQFTKVAAGGHTLKVRFEGYNDHQEQVTLKADSTVTVELNTDGPIVNLDALVGVTDGAVVDEAMLTLTGNVNDLLTTRGEVNPLTTAISISQLQAIVNGTVFNIEVEDDGHFEQPVPLDPGANTIQLRVFDHQGNAGTSNILRVRVTLPRLDLRVILSWDTADTDVDLHVFQRRVDEPNVVAAYDYWDENRHVYWYNDIPSDFGDTEASNPILDIDDTDGYGPETVLLQEATPGNYHIWVHYYDALGSNVEEVPSKATVRIILNGGTDDAETYVFDQMLSNDWDVWYVGTIRMPSGELIEVEPIDLEQ